jgi:small subunit ribosomal protein S16
VAVTLRLARHGMKKRPFYRIVAAEKGARRDGRFLEIVGTYNPMTAPATVVFKEDKVDRWLSFGAQLSDQVAALVRVQFPGKLETIEQGRTAKIQARRKQRKERAAARQ